MAAAQDQRTRVAITKAATHVPTVVLASSVWRGPPTATSPDQ
ncbi:hypothetical protein BZL30_9471 [Mycobacterium kansasii]|uniref:Uncharacterized protein n=1 Tax=Mycobacterium kansasii TaxID=1768 RepID=A0A1V3W8X6_MYCKA|nr:hypothetical protein BZL30_9471 [Mycobacterium kansasii]